MKPTNIFLIFCKNRKHAFLKEDRQHVCDALLGSFESAFYISDCIKNALQALFILLIAWKMLGKNSLQLAPIQHTCDMWRRLKLEARLDTDGATNVLARAIFIFYLLFFYFFWTTIFYVGIGNCIARSAVASHCSRDIAVCGAGAVTFFCVRRSYW